MAKTQKEFLISWLNDAHATEQKLVQALENQIQDTGDHPHIQARLKQHLEESRTHAEMVEKCLHKLGGSPSALKDKMATAVGFINSIVPSMAKDDLIKFILANYAAEHFEIASYKALIVAAREYGDEEIARACENILKDEEEMARWLDDHLPGTLRTVFEAQPTAPA